jgi:hypothetical protein
VGAIGGLGGGRGVLTGGGAETGSEKISIPSEGVTREEVARKKHVAIA